MFGPKKKMRFRPSIFHLQSQVLRWISGMKKGTSGWKYLGCGMVDQLYLRIGYNPEKWHGYAFGMGVERIAMLKYEIDDIKKLL